MNDANRDSLKAGHCGRRLSINQPVTADKMCPALFHEFYIKMVATKNDPASALAYHFHKVFGVWIRKAPDQVGKVRIDES
jgi:hypothetical protein